MQRARRFGKPQTKNVWTPQKNVDLRGLRSTANFARERGAKIAATKAARFFKALVVVVVVGVLFIGAIGFAGMIAYSIKSGEELNLKKQFTELVKKTPLRSFLGEQPSEQQSLQVIGLQNIPEYPESTFVFADYVERIGSDGYQIKEKVLSANDAQALYTFLASGQSVYRLPLNAEWEDIQSFYRAKLSELGWKTERSVAVSETEYIPGDYYTKDGKGLHVYSVASDIWYEVITQAQAEQGLHDKIVAYKAKQELVAAASGKDLPVSAEWQLRYSRDWEVELQKNPIFGVNNVIFTHDSSKERLFMLVVDRYRENVADITYKQLETYGVNYISTWLTTQQTTVTLQGFTRTEREVASIKAMEFSDVKQSAHFLVLVNPKNSMVYVFQYIGKENPEFFEYVKGNLKIR
ncbi:MAG: hypothetical protein ACOYT9_04530 [Patescibacteria group bacterium]|jgi:hypothetical protein